MWVERTPNEGETVKIEFAEWTKLGTKIGVFLRRSGGRDIIDFGSQNMWLDPHSCYFVWEI